MNATMMIAFTKWPAVFQPASSKPMVNGEEATTEFAVRSCGESEGHISPWKNDIPMKTNRIR